MILKGRLYVESPIYRGNARKTLFTRDGDGIHKLVSLAGEIDGTAQALMDAFVGQSKNGKNIGLINQLWQRLYGSPLPGNLINKVECNLQKESYPRKNFFDLRMGIKLDEDRWAAEANANYKMETLLRNSVFDFTLSVKDDLLKKEENDAKLYYILEEIKAGRFWFGAGKSKGLGRVRLEMKLPYSEPKSLPPIHPKANHLTIDLSVNAQNPVLIGWNWGKVDPNVPSFASIEGHLLIDAIGNIPDVVRDRLKMALGGAILNTEDWKRKFSEYLPRIIAIWLKERSSGKVESWVLPASALSKLSKGKHALTQKILNKVEKLAEQPFPSQEAADAAFQEALGKKANMAKRITDLLEKSQQTQQSLDPETWRQISESLGLDKTLDKELGKKIQDEAELIRVLAPACTAILPQIFQQVDQQIKLIQSDSWVDAEILGREEHLLIKTMLSNGRITEYQWNDPGMTPEGIRSETWREFLEAHKKVRFQHMLNAKNLKKSIVNDKNHIEFLKTYREQTRQELSQPHHIDFRAGGHSNREISKKYGKPYDTIFMRMLTWKPSSKEKGAWEAYIPGSTIKGAFRKRAAQVLNTLWGGSSRKTIWVMNRLFGTQGQRGVVFFSDAYLADPGDSRQSWCSMDGIRMDAKTGQPIETSKRDYLFAYGTDLAFQCRLDIQDMEEKDMECISLIFHLLRDFQTGEIPIGGEKTSGFGWVEAEVSKFEWLTATTKGVSAKLFGKAEFKADGIWQRLEMTGEKAAEALKPPQGFSAEEKISAPPQARAGFISHRSFGGYCGMLNVEAEVLTPVNVQESGEPSMKCILPEGPVNGWDFFSFSPPESSQRNPDRRKYALPSQSLRGMIRHIYTIASDSKKESPDLSRLNPTDSLFGWVGNGPNQALMARLSFSFGEFEKPEFSWFRVPYPYGNWQYIQSDFNSGGEWKEIPDSSAQKILIEERWRIFPHTPLAPIARQVGDFKPDTVQARYFRGILPGAKARFTIRFWNLLEEELQRLIWSVGLESGLGHKIGNNRYLGFGSIKLNILPESYLTDWNKRYRLLSTNAGKSDWQTPLNIEKFINAKVIRHYDELKKVLNASSII